MGRFRGELPVDEGIVQLKRPIDPSDRNSTEVVVENVPYRTTSPWPDATSIGQSLHRIQPRGAPELPSSWLAGPASPGQYDAVDRILGDSNLDGVFDVAVYSMHGRTGCVGHERRDVELVGPKQNVPD
jgi:hypothetical protein